MIACGTYAGLVALYSKFGEFDLAAFPCVTAASDEGYPIQVGSPTVAFDRRVDQCQAYTAL